MNQYNTSRQQHEKQPNPEDITVRETTQSRGHHSTRTEPVLCGQASRYHLPSANPQPVGSSLPVGGGRTAYKLDIWRHQGVEEDC